jgi:hypothetical protein
MLNLARSCKRDVAELFFEKKKREWKPGNVPLTEREGLLGICPSKKNKNRFIDRDELGV